MIGGEEEPAYRDTNADDDEQHERWMEQSITVTNSTQQVMKSSDERALGWSDKPKGDEA